MVGESGQPYAFTNDNPLNSSDPLGLKIVGTGSVSCGAPVATMKLRVIACGGTTSSGKSAVGITVFMPTIATTLPGFGTITTQTSVSVLGNGNISVGTNGSVTIQNGNGAVTFNPNGTSSGSANFPNSPISIGSDGSFSGSFTGHVGSDKVQWNISATFVPNEPPPPNPYGYDVVLAGGGFSIAGAIVWLGYQAWKVFTGESPVDYSF